jgi:putative phosphoribosyl transferase
VVSLGVSAAEMDELIAGEQVELERRVQAYRGGRPLPPLGERDVVLVDDGLATGVTARAALAALKGLRPRPSEHPGRLVLAVPVCAPDQALALVARGVELVCLARPVNFRAVGSWYREFDQTTDAEVRELLQLADRHLRA